ncbi:uncharacterized protein LOC124532354 isoform X2 [Vanessa cardui]|uniref:uncharacterized protein LOC124532354 isoform X2 n=1 Tax=Vanessa cardui TaxID=171605 RepID=UPI001F14018A|nr:uncharacterized protein LOC124532354 isoform X2 [Vanessa cardui]
MKSAVILALLVVTCSRVLSAPIAHNTEQDTGEVKSDVPVKELENLKMEEASKETVPGMQSEHMEFHRLDSVQANGELVSRLEQHASADATGDEKPLVHAQTQLDLPAEGVHKVLVQDGAHISVLDATAATTIAPEEQTTKVFHGAARLIQPGSGTNTPQNGHTAVRRAFNADITKETNNNMDHYSAYAGVQYSPLDMAEYVFWTGDERGVTTAIEEFLQEGMMTKEEAIAFLQEIKFNIDYLRAHYTQNIKAAEESAQQEKLRNFIMEQNAKEYQYHQVPPQSFPFGGSPDIIRSISGKTWDLSNNLGVIPSLPVTSDLRPEPVKRTYDPVLQTNVISTSDYDRENPVISEEEYEEMMDKLRAADTLYTEYTLEEIIYQLAKMMFSQSLGREAASARAATQRFMAFLELEAQRGQLSRTIQKKVLDVMMAALTDTINDHPELLQARDGLGLSPSNRIMHQFLETSAPEPSVSRAILAAYKDELLKGPPLHKFSFAERN